MAGTQLDVQYTSIEPLTLAGVTLNAPLVTPVALGDVNLIAVQIRIPPGHSGFTGISVNLGGSRLVPWSDKAAWIVGDDEQLTFNVGREVDNGLQIWTFNGGKFPHRHYCRFAWVAIDNPAPAFGGLTLLPLDQLQAS